MKEAGVTVLIPAYRSDQRLVRALESLVNQTYLPAAVELSFDAAPAYVPPPLPAVSGLRIRHQSARLGWVAHVNRLLEQVSTPYFLILSHDDAITPGYLHAAVTALEADPTVVVAHGSVRNHGLRTDLITTNSIIGEPVERLKEFLRRGPTSAELGWRGVIRTKALATGIHLRSRRSDGMFSNTLWALELLFSGNSTFLEGEYYEKFTDPDGLSRAYHGRSREERSRMLAESVANLAALLVDHGMQDPEREELLRMWTAWLLAFQGNWNVFWDEPNSDSRTLLEVRPALAGFVADLATSLVTPPRR